MPEDQTLLAHIALKLASHPENIAVEALGHILSTSPAAVRALEDVLQTGDAEVGEIAQVQTQANDEEGSRPDLAGRNADGTERVLIEAKFWAGLTERRLKGSSRFGLSYADEWERRRSSWSSALRRQIFGSHQSAASAA